MSISKRFLTFVSAAITAFSFFAVGELVAQQYSGLDMPQGFEVGPELKASASKDEKKAWNKLYGPAKKRIKAGTKSVEAVILAGGDVKSDAAARKFLERVVFPAMTQTNPATLSSLGTKRQKFLKDFLGSSVTGVGRARMIDFTIETLQAYCIDSTLHPSARVNAVVLISQLTDRALARNQPPIASRRAFAVLQTILGGQDKSQFPEYLKIAAMSGMISQCEMNVKSGQTIDPAAMRQLADIVLELLSAEADREEAPAAYWKKRQAVQVAGIIKDAKTLPALLTILKDDASSFELKLDVVRAIAKTGAMGSAPQTNSTVLVAVCSFAAKSIASEANGILGAREKMIRDGILFEGVDMMQTTKRIDFEPEDGSGNRPALRGNDRNDRDAARAPLIELPNYQLNISRNRIRAVATFSQQAIGVTNRLGLRPNLDPKAEALASRTIGQLNALLEKSSVGLIDKEERVVRGEPTPQEKDQNRKTSYVDQMVTVCTDSARVLTDLLTGYSTP